MRASEHTFGLGQFARSALHLCHFQSNGFRQGNADQRIGNQEGRNTIRISTCEIDRGASAHRLGNKRHALQTKRIQNRDEIVCELGASGKLGVRGLSEASGIHKNDLKIRSPCGHLIEPARVISAHSMQ